MGDAPGRTPRAVGEVAAELGCSWHPVNVSVRRWGLALLDADTARISHVEALGLDETLMGRRDRFRARAWSTSIVDVGLERLVRLYRRATMKIITRVTVETVAQQKDPMKRIRANGGARSALSNEGIVVLGHYRHHAEIAEALDLPVPQAGESISVQLTPAERDHHQGVVEIGGRRWRIARDNDPAHPAPILPSVSGSRR